MTKLKLRDSKTLSDDDYFDNKPLPGLPTIPDKENKNRIKSMKNYIIRILPNPGPRITHREEKARPQISSPINFDHVLHVGFNPETGEFEGLPPEWERLLSNSGITSTERKENPDTIIAVSSLKTITHFFLLISSSQNSRILI